MLPSSIPNISNLNFLSFFNIVSLAKSLSILLTFSKNHLLISLILFPFILYSFLLLVVGLLCSSLTISFRCEVIDLISFFLMCVFIAINLLWAILSLHSIRFGVVCFIFIGIKYFLMSFNIFLWPFNCELNSRINSRVN